MSEFYKRFLMEEGRRLSPDNSRFVALGAFGKHPGWDDHVEDLGLETDSLNLAKLVFYVRGVGGQIDTGAWEKLKEEQRLTAFDHSFVWHRGDQFLMGRMWSSSDGKGRTRYPMIICAHCIGVPLGWAMESVMPRLADIENACRSTKAPEEVRTILSRARTGLRNLFANIAPDSAASTPDAATVSQFVGAEAFGPANEGWCRILYSLQSLTTSFGAGRFNLKGDLSSLRAQQVRVPAGTIPPAREVPLWSRFFGAYVDRLVPTLLVWPTSGKWLDATFGEPSTQEFFCLRASRVAVPLTTEIPYDLDQKFRDQAAQQLNDFRNGKTPRPSTSSQRDSRDNGTQSFTQRFLKGLGGKFWLFLIAILVLAIVAVAAVVLRPRAGPEKAALPDRQAIENNNHSRPASPAASPSSTSPMTPVEVNQTPTAVATSQALAAGVSQEETQEAQPATGEAAVASPTEQARVAEEAKPTEDAKSGSKSTPASVPPTAVAMTAPQTNAAAAGESSSNARPMPASAQDQVEPIGKTITNGIGMVLLWVAGLPGSGDGGWVGKNEVTQAEYQKITDTNPSKFPDPDQPVENVDWHEATSFCQRLNASEGAAGRLPAGFGYALPTQAQWDFFLGGASFDNAITSRDRQVRRTSPARVGTLPPNRFGLYDVLGNVWEWCADGDSSGQKVLMGGAYDNGKIYQFRPLEPDSSRRLSPDSKTPDAGFRCVLVRQP